MNRYSEIPYEIRFYSYRTAKDGAVFTYDTVSRGYICRSENGKLIFTKTLKEAIEYDWKRSKNANS